jgi:hypothetical protein
MTYQDAVSDLVRLWDLLPLLTGPRWPELEQSLLDSLERLVEADTDDHRDQCAGQVLRLCLPHEVLRRALEAAVRRDDNRSGQGDVVPWAETAAEVTAAIERSSRPGGGQWLAANLEDHPAGQPLRAGAGYILTIGVAGDEPPAEALAAEEVPPGAGPGPDEDSIQLTVELRGDADIQAVSSVLTLPRSGASPDLARFRLTPHARAGQLTLTAVVTRGSMFVQVLTLTVQVWAEEAPAGPSRRPTVVRGRATGRPLAEGFGSDGPDASLEFIAGDLMLRTDAEAIRAPLPFGPDELREISEVPRAALQEIVQGVLDGTAAHQAGLAIAPEVYQESLAALVRAGALMFRTLFFGSKATEELKQLGRALQHVAARNGPLWVETVADSPIVPWHLLAFPDAADPAAADPSHILGLRHRITYMPMRKSTRRPSLARSLRTDGGPLRVVLAVNRDIDQHGGTRRDLVDSQVAAWQQRENAAGGALTVAVPAEREVLNVLVRGTPPAELLYFFCHAYPNPDPDRLGPAAVCLEFTGGHMVSLEDLLLGEPSDWELDTAPLVVLNACASVGPASSVYASFLPCLLGRGARGVIGTEADVPPVFAAAWAKMFFSRLLDGVPLADAAFKTAWDLIGQYRNLLGLVYSLHCHGRNLVSPAVPGAPAGSAAGT